jgi:hypothetical protein
MKALVRAFRRHSVRPIRLVKTADLRAMLLDEFKKHAPPHWPFITKNRCVKFDNALMVAFNVGNSRSQEINMTHCWWRPAVLTSNMINSWINGANGRAPHLFRILNIELASGNYPEVTLRKERKYIHTTSLLAGVNELLANELAGRRSLQQGAHYDLRTPSE